MIHKITDSALFASPPLRIETRPPTTNQWLVDAIRHAIILGECAAGQAIRQEEFAARYQVSRMPIREALRTLSAEGWVQLVPNKGAYVIPLEPQDAIELFESRAALEAVAAKESVERLSKEQSAHAQQAQARLSTALEEEYFEAHKAFHLSLYQAATPRLQQLISQLMDASERYLRFESKTMTVSRADRKEHAAMLDAAMHRQVDKLAEMLQEHVADAGRDIAKRLRVSQ